MTTRTSSSSTTINSVAYLRSAKKPNRLAVAYLWYLETVCEALGHPGACVLFNSSGTRFGKWWHQHFLLRLWEAAGTFTRWERQS